jgi:hypothetical protein
MDHPDITRMERYGTLPTDKPAQFSESDYVPDYSAADAWNNQMAENMRAKAKGVEVNEQVRKDHPKAS